MNAPRETMLGWLYARVREGNDDVQVIPVYAGARVIIGRSPNCDVRFPCATVARRHAAVFSDERDVFIEDLDSHCGLTINEMRAAQPQRLDDGDQVRVGQCIVDFEALPAASATDDEAAVGWLVLEDGARHALGPRHDVIIGRVGSLVLSDMRLARQQTRVTVDHGEVSVRDLGGHRGTFINGRRLGDERAPLRPGDRLCVGSHRIALELATASTPVDDDGGGGDDEGKALEHAVSTRPGDDAALAIWADWLQMRGSPLGEHIALAMRARDKHGGNPAAHDSERQLRERQGEALLGPITGYDGVRMQWRDGLLDSLHLQACPLPPLFELLHRPVCARLRAVHTVAGLPGDPAGVVAAIARAGRAATIETLDLKERAGDFHPSVAPLLRLRALADFDRLQWLYVYGRVDLADPSPRLTSTLRELTLATPTPWQTLRSLCSSTWSALERLVVERYAHAAQRPSADARVSPAELGQLLARERLPKLRALELRGFGATEQLAALPLAREVTLFAHEPTST